MKTAPLWVLVALILGFFIGSFSTSFVDGSSANLLVSHNHVKQDQIKVTRDKVVIDFEGKSLRWAEFEDSNSMLPLLDNGYDGFEIVPESKEDIKLGDVISFEYKDKVYVHRVVEIGQDKFGWYAITKGDSNNIEDEGKRRFENIKGILVGVIF